MSDIDRVRAQIERLGGTIIGAHPTADALVRAAVWPAGRVFRAGDQFAVDGLTLGVVPLSAIEDPQVDEAFFTNHPDAVCFGYSDAGAMLVYLSATGDPANPAAHLFDYYGNDVSGPVPLAELLAGVEVDVVASELTVPPENHRFFRTFDGTPVFVFEDTVVLKLTDGETFEVERNGVFESDEFPLANAQSLKELLPLALPVAGKKHGPVPPVAGRFFYTANGSLVFVRAPREAGANVLVLVGGHSHGRGDGCLPMYEYRVDRRGLYAGDSRFEVRPEMSLREMLAFPTDAEWRGTIVPPPRAEPVAVPAFGPLSPEVIRHVERLGGVFAPAPAVPPNEVWDGVPVPEPLRRFLRDVTWPDDVTYTNDDGTLRVWSYLPTLTGFGNAPPYRYLRYYPEYIGIGINDGGNYLLFTLLDCDDPTDPPVYRLDHDEYEEEPYGPQPLSEFLAELQLNSPRANNP